VEVHIIVGYNLQRSSKQHEVTNVALKPANFVISYCDSTPETLVTNYEQ
jgi:hypothetical protein